MPSWPRWKTSMAERKKDSPRSKTFTPPASVKRNASRAYKVRKALPASQRAMVPSGGGQSTGEKRMHQLRNGRGVSLGDMIVMRAWFSRHDETRPEGGGRAPSKWWQAWNGWGGDEARSWVNATLRREMPNWWASNAEGG